MGEPVYGLSGSGPPLLTGVTYDASTPTVWLALAFGNSGNGGNYLYPFSSTDGVTFRKLATSPIYPTTQRDPSIYLVEPGGHIWVFCSGFPATIFESVGGIEQQLSVVATISGLVGTTSIWAGNWFIDSDGSVHIVMCMTSSGSTTNFSLYEVHPTATDFTTWSTPVSIGGSGWPTSCIDPCIVKSGSTYYLFFKDDVSSSIDLASSSSPFSGYSVIKTGDWAGWRAAIGGTGVEGPKVVQLPNGNWRIYFTSNSGYDAIHIYSSETSDQTLQSGWSTPTTLSSLDGYNHALPILNY
jgi:hypothetical protein